MKSASVLLKDGRSISGYVWEWKPKEGYMCISGVGDGGDCVKVLFEDVQSGTMQRPIASKQEMQDIIASGNLGSPEENVLDYARKSGWQG